MGKFKITERYYVPMQRIELGVKWQVHAKHYDENGDAHYEPVSIYNETTGEYLYAGPTISYKNAVLQVRYLKSLCPDTSFEILKVE